MQTTIINGLTQLVADDGKWITQSYPTMFREFYKSKILTSKDSVSNYRDADNDEYQSFTPPKMEKEGALRSRRFMRLRGRCSTTARGIMS